MKNSPEVQEKIERLKAKEASRNFFILPTTSLVYKPVSDSNDTSEISLNTKSDITSNHLITRINKPNKQLLIHNSKTNQSTNDNPKLIQSTNDKPTTIVLVDNSSGSKITNISSKIENMTSRVDNLLCAIEKSSCRENNLTCIEINSPSTVYNSPCTENNIVNNLTCTENNLTYTENNSLYTENNPLNTVNNLIRENLERLADTAVIDNAKYKVDDVMIKIEEVNDDVFTQSAQVHLF